MFVPCDNVAAVAMHVYHAGEDCVNVFNIKRTGLTITVSDLDQYCASIKTWWIENIRGLVSNQTRLWKLIATRLTVQNDIQRELLVSAPDGTGTSNFDALPGSVTAAVSWRTANTGKSYRGRTYHIGLTEDQVSGNHLEDDALTNLNSSYADLVNVVHADSFDSLVVLSRRNNGAWRTAGVATPITNVIMDSAVDSQRRRLLGRGN